MLLTSEGDNSLLISLILALSHMNMAGISDDKLDIVLLEALLLYDDNIESYYDDCFVDIHDRNL